MQGLLRWVKRLGLVEVGDLDLLAEFIAEENLIILARLLLVNHFFKTWQVWLRLQP